MFDQDKFWRNFIGLRDTEAITTLEKNAYIKDMEKGEKIIKEGDIVTEVAFIISGVLKAIYEISMGKKKCIVLDIFLGSGNLCYTFGSGHKVDLHSRSHWRQCSLVRTDVLFDKTDKG